MVESGVEMVESTEIPPGRTVPELLALSTELLKELQTRGRSRSKNNPAAEIAELLVVRALNLRRLTASNMGYDAEDSLGKKYEIKARRITSTNRSRQLSFIRGLDRGHFDFLVGVLFHEDFSVFRACVVPISVVRNQARYSEHVRGWVFHLRDSIWEQPGVRDITREICENYASL